MDAPSAGEAIGYVAEKAWESNEVRPVLLAPIEAAGIGTLVGFLKMATTVRLGTNLTKSQLKSISSLENQIYTHQAKLDEYIKNPMKFDNKGFLKNAPNDEVKQKIIQSRINHLKQEIKTFQNNIKKIRNE